MKTTKIFAAIFCAVLVVIPSVHGRMEWRDSFYDYTVKNINGRRVKLEQYRGTVSDHDDRQCQGQGNGEAGPRPRWGSSRAARPVPGCEFAIPKPFSYGACISLWRSSSSSSSSAGWVCLLQIWRFSQTLCVCEPQVEFIRVLGLFYL